MPAISTDDCKRAIAAAWPAEFGAGKEDFKRVSKKGKKGEPNNQIVRVFYHRKLPLQAIVTEENGAITRTEIKGLGIFDVPDDSPEMDNIFELTDSAQAHEFYEKHDIFKPQDFYFYVSDKPDEFGGDWPHWFVIVPAVYFERAGCQYDQELSPLIGRHLPDDCGESSSTNFNSSMTPDDLRAELAKRGFQRSEKFDAFMDR